MKLKIISLSLLFVLLITALVGSNLSRFTVSAVTPDLYIADTAGDDGTEENFDDIVLWASPEIWIRNDPDPSYQPYPFADPNYPTSPHTPHQDPLYRDPKFSRPNYIYVRVHNRGDGPSQGTERLRIFWAKATTSNFWPHEWGGGEWTHEVDYTDNVCGPDKLYGQEVTKPRKNAQTASLAERDAYREAILGIGSYTDPKYEFPGGLSYFHKQQEVHADTTYAKHGNPVFTPWHREFINRYELLLQEKNPSVKLLYWDWTKNPETGPFNFFTSAFMGASGSGPGNAPIGEPFNPSSSPTPTLAPPTVYRDMEGMANTNTPVPVNDHILVNTKANYGGNTTARFRYSMEVQAHNHAHRYIGGLTGDLVDPMKAAQDPIFYMLHANADRIWAKWQRKDGKLSRLEPGATYDSDNNQPQITSSPTPSIMGPWDGKGNIRPWTPGDGYIIEKNPKDPSVVSPPIYDDAPLLIPKLQPGESVIMQIPWYPPNPEDYAGNQCDKKHFCLLSRIETQDTPDYGMHLTEVPEVWINVRNNNNIAWRNLDLLDDPAFFKTNFIIVRNSYSQAISAGLRFLRLPKGRDSFFKFGRVILTLPPHILKRWREVNPEAEKNLVFRDKDGTEKLEIAAPETGIPNIPLAPGEAFSLGIQFDLSPDYQADADTVAAVSMAQVGAPGDPNRIVGGEQYEIPLNKLTLIKKASDWRYWNGPIFGNRWTKPDFEDTKWRDGKAELGYGDNPETTIDGGPPNQRRITTYFRHIFELDDLEIFRDLILQLKRDDGAVVYLNGTEIHRVNLPAGAITSGILATREVKGVEEELFFPVQVNPQLLRTGKNVVAVEVHQNSPSTEDAGFDLELNANYISPRFAPGAAITSVANGSLVQKGQNVSLNVEALDSDGTVGAVSFFVDGQQAGTVNSPPFNFLLKGLDLGVHRLKTVALDNDGQEAVQEITVTVLDNLPPVTALLQPPNQSVFMSDDVITAIAQASDSGGSIQRIDFYLTTMNIFAAEEVLVGSASSAPYSVKIDLKGFPPGHYMLTAIAVDNLGETGQSSPAHISIGMKMKH